MWTFYDEILYTLRARVTALFQNDRELVGAFVLRFKKSLLLYGWTRHTPISAKNKFSAINKPKPGRGVETDQSSDQSIFERTPWNGALELHGVEKSSSLL